MTHLIFSDLCYIFIREKMANAHQHDFAIGKPTRNYRMKVR